METTKVTTCVSGPITGKRLIGKGTYEFVINGTTFHVRDNSTHAKKIKGASRAIVAYEVGDSKRSTPRIVKVVCDHTFQQVLQANALYAN